MNYINMKLKKTVVFEGYEVEKGGKRYMQCDKHNKPLALDKACEVAVGLDMMDNVMVYKVVITKWLNEDNEVIREQQSKALAAKVWGRKVKGSGGWTDYEE